MVEQNANINYVTEEVRKHRGEEFIVVSNSHLPPGFPQSVTPQTTRKWLHSIGFSPKLSKKACTLMDMKEMM